MNIIPLPVSSTKVSLPLVAEYALNLENKKTFFTQENINEISLILQFLKKINEFQYDEWINKLEQELDNLIKIDGKEVKKNK